MMMIPEIPLMEPHENSQVVVKLENLRNEVPNVVLQMPYSPAAAAAKKAKSSYYSFKEITTILFGGWGTILVQLSYLRENSTEMTDYMIVMTVGACVLAVSFVLWIVHLLFHQAGMDVMTRNFIARFSLYLFGYGGVAFTLGNTFFSVYFPQKYHIPFFWVLLAITVLVTVIMEFRRHLLLCECFLCRNCFTQKTNTVKDNPRGAPVDHNGCGASTSTNVCGVEGSHGAV